MKIISGGVTAPLGFQAGGIACGIKKNNQLDLALIFSETPAQAAGVYTANKVKAAPIRICQEHLKNGLAQAIIANSGNANACVGEAGFTAARGMAQEAAKLLGIAPEMVLVASTGVIGVPLLLEKITSGLQQQGSGFISAAGGVYASQAIMTTDTFAKEIAVEFEVKGKTVRIGGIAKGSGMIHPNMATMLGFISTDIAIKQELLQEALGRASSVSFNRITVDGDTSTNDCLLVLANGKAGNELIIDRNTDYLEFAEALNLVCTELAKMIARDGEGATKFVEIQVTGASTEQSAVLAGKAVATSNLVKTAIFGEDANWGRILAAVGYSGIEFDPDQVAIYIGDLLVCRGGTGLAFDEQRAKAILKQKEITIRIELGIGGEDATVWTCDLSYDYVKINGSYRT